VLRQRKSSLVVEPDIGRDVMQPVFQAISVLPSRRQEGQGFRQMPVHRDGDRERQKPADDEHRLPAAQRDERR
jgi:hypothetical protein